jgi:putative aldouronate transport system permease protein
MMNRQNYLLFLPIAIYFFVFSYLPMFGITMAFQDFRPTRGFFGSDFVGLENFIKFFTSPSFGVILRNTLVISLLSIVIAFPLSIIFALLLSELKAVFFKRTVQTISYLPYFISAVVICGLVIDFVSSNGVVTNVLNTVFGFPKTNLLQDPKYFWWVNLGTEIWQGLGYGSIIFIAAMGNVSPEHHEAAAIDGANRLQRVWHVTMPALIPTIMTMLILRIGMVLTVGADKILLLYNPSIYETADVISSHVARMGIEQAQYSYSAAVGLFNSVVGTLLLVGSNTLSRKAAETSIY